MGSMLDKLGGRKAVLVAAIIAIGAAVDLATPRGLSENLLTLLMGVLALFVAGNGVEHVVALRRSPASGAGLADVKALQDEVAKVVQPLQIDMQNMQQALLVMGKGIARASQDASYVAEYTKKVAARYPNPDVD